MSELESTPGIPDTLGVSISGQANVTAHDIIGRDKIIHGDEYIGYTAAQVTVLLDKIRAEYQTKPFDGRSPYIGLASFQERDADKFFGREALTAELVTRVAASAASNARALFVAGPSGSGKSSLVRAGLIPALRKGAPLWSPALGSEHWLYETCKPGRAPLDELGLAVAKLARNADLRSAMTTRGLTDATFLNQQADMALTDDKNQRAVLFIDQFEEIFTQLTTPDQEKERVAFLNLLTHAATVENGRVLVIFTLRSDFVSNCASYPNLNALVNQQFIQVGAMTPDELVSAIARPACQVGLRIDPALISQIVNDVRGEPGALPLMQFALQDLFDAEKSKGELTLDGYTARGGLHQALERHADAEFAKLDDAEKQLARNVFSGLIEIGRGRADTKRTARFGELVPAGADAARVQALVLKLADEKVRLITTDEQDGKETVTLAHERLIDAWEWLRRLVDENRDAIALQNEIAQDAQEWEQQKRDESYLYRGARLATAQEKLQQNKLVLSGLAQEFVETAIKAREEAKRKEASRTQRLIVAVGAAAAVFAVLAVIAFFFQQQAEARRIEAERQEKIARSRELAALARSKFGANPELGMLLAIEANSAPGAINLESEDVLREFLVRFPLNATLKEHENVVASAQFSLDGKRIVTGSWDKTARVWDATSGKRLVVLNGHEGAVTSAQFSPDGTWIVTASGNATIGANGDIMSHGDGTARVWDAMNGKPLAILQQQGIYIQSAQFVPDGKHLFTFECDKPGQDDFCFPQRMRLWDVSTLLDGKGNAELAVLREDGGAIVSAQFSPDGSKIATLGCHSLENGICVTDTARLWNVADGQELAVLNTGEENIIHAQFVAQGLYVVTGNTDGRVRVLDISGKERVVLAGDGCVCEFDVTSAQISPDGEQIVTGTVLGAARVWDMRYGAKLADLRANGSSNQSAHLGQITTIQFTPDSKYILTASLDDYAVRTWDASSGAEVAVLYANNANLFSAQLSPDGTRVVTSTADGIARVWNTLGGDAGAVLRGHSFPLNTAEFSPDGRMIITTSGTEGLITDATGGTVRLWDSSGRQLTTLRGHAVATTGAQFSARDGARILTIGCDQVESNHCAVWTARVWDTAASRNTAGGQALVVLKVPEKKLWSARISPDGRWVVTVGCDSATQSYCLAGSARVWDAASDKELGIVRGNPAITGAEFSYDGTQIVIYGCAELKQDNTCARSAAWVWNVTDIFENGGKEIATLLGHTDWIRSAQFSPDGKWIVTGSRDGTARLWDATNGKELAVMGEPARGDVHAQFSPDGKRIVSIASHGEAQIWDTTTRKQITALNKLDERILRARYSPDGQLLVTAMDSNKASVWDTATGKELTTLYGHGGRIYDAEFSPDGKRIVTASFDATARIHFVNIQAVIELAKQRVERDLTCEERVQYLREKNVCPTPTPAASPTP